MLFEDSQSAGNKNFVAAFANSNAGDVSGNVEFNSSLNNYKYDDGTNHEVDDKVHMIDQGERQFNAATQIYNIANEEVKGPIEVRHQYIDIPFSGKG